jgi:chemotaxis protein MotB
MGRKKKPEEHVNHERWMVSYADFITLLFAFFVMLYSISIVNTGKFKVLSESITAAFTDPQRSLEPIQVGDLVRAPAEMQDKSFADPQPKPIRPVEMWTRCFWKKPASNWMKFKTALKPQCLR